MAQEKSERQKLADYCEMRLTSMKAQRSDYESEWREIASFAQPSRSRFLSTARDKGSRRRAFNNKLLDTHGVLSFRTLTMGLTSGLTSSSRPWFKLSLPSEELSDQPGVRAWLSEVETAIYAFLAKTNFYSAAMSGYAELGLFGTEACVMVEHKDHGAVCHSLTAGEYWIGLSDGNTPDTLARFCPMTARQVVQFFGNDAPKLARQAYDTSDHERLVEVYNLIEPNPQHVPGRFGSKPWRSIYWTPGEGIIRVTGYEEQPFWAPRWTIMGNDTYGVSPGMEALPAMRELQVQARRRNEAIDFLVKPEKLVKQGLRITGEPGRIVSATGLGQDSVLIPYEMPYQAIAMIRGEIDKAREEISGAAFADLFNAITNMPGIQPRTVEEIASRNEEKLTQLGPVIDNVTKEKLSIVVDRTFGVMLRGGLLPHRRRTFAANRLRSNSSRSSHRCSASLVWAISSARSVSLVGCLAPMPRHWTS